MWQCILVVPATQEVETGGSWWKARLGKSMRLSLEKKKASKHEALIVLQKTEQNKKNPH
jgi:hypothetical protein